VCDCRAGIATIIEHNGYPTRDRRRQRINSRLKTLQRTGEQLLLVVDGQHDTHRGYCPPSIALAHLFSQMSSTNSSSLWWTTVKRPGV
jgi:hypothetical protein